MGQVAQVKVPMRLVKEGFKVPQKEIDAAGEHAQKLVTAVSVVIHADGEQQPGTVLADIRGKSGSDAYLTTKDYGEGFFCVVVCWFAVRVCVGAALCGVQSNTL